MNYLQKDTKVIVAILTLMIGLGTGYFIGLNATGNKHMMYESCKTMRGGCNMDDMDMKGMMHSMNANIENKSGDDFDQAFLKEMIIHHEGAVEMAERALQNAKRQEIKDLAKNIIEAQNKEIREMKDWQTDWFDQ